MTNRRYKPVLYWFGVAAFAAAAGGCAGAGSHGSAYKPAVNPVEFQEVVDNPYFPLVPGTTLKYTERSMDGISENTVTVTHETKMIMGVKCVVVHDTLTKDGKLTEDTYDWYTQQKNGAVWYFGEATKEYKAGGRVSTEGSWEAGVGGAQPGIVIPADPQPGTEAYRQEYLRGEAEDMGQVAALGEKITVPYGTLTNCLKTKEWSMVESGSEQKWYAKGIGFVRSESTGGETSELISVVKE